MTSGDDPRDAEPPDDGDRADRSSETGTRAERPSGAGTVVALFRRLLRAALADDDWSREFLAELDAELERRGGESRWRVALWYGVQVASPRTLEFVWMTRRRTREDGMGKGKGGGSSWGTWWNGLAIDVRRALRGMVREPRVSAFVVASLAVGIGANAAMYGVGRRLFLDGPMHVRAPSELVRVYLRVPDATSGTRTAPWIPFATAEAIRDQARLFQGATLYRFDERLARLGEEVVPIRVAAVDGGYFDLLGVVPHAGRFFDETSVDAGVPPVVLASGTAQSAFGSAGGAVGRAVTLGGRDYTVVAVAPDGFAGPHLERVDAWVPLDRSMAPNRNWWLVARLPAGGTVDRDGTRAAEEANAVHRRTDVPRSFAWAKQGTIALASIGADDAGERSAESDIARLLSALALVVLLIATVNVVNLLLARAVDRQREVGVRLALGIAPWRLVRLLLVESATLGLVAGLASLPVTYVGGVALRRLLLPAVAWTSSPVDGGLVALTLALALLVGTAVGLLPARHAFAAGRFGGVVRQRSGGSARTGTQAALATAQLTLSAVLLTCAGLFLSSFRAMEVTDLGVDAAGAYALTIRSLDPDVVAPGSDREGETYGRALRAISDLEGDDRVALTIGLPFLYNFGWSVSVPGLDSIPELPGGGPYVSFVTAGYFEAIGTPIVRGRGITTTDVDAGERVVVVSRSMEATLWPDGQALGACLRIGGTTSECSRVVGVAEDVHRVGYREPPSMQLYVPYGPAPFGGSALVVRPARSGAASLERLRRAIVEGDPGVDHVEVASLGSLLSAQIRPWRLGSAVLVTAAALAVLVSLLGVYGVLSHVVAQRRREIGIRIALGATSDMIRALFVRLGLVAGGVGTLLGVGLVLVGRRWIEPLLFETSVADGRVIGAVLGLLLTATTLACLLPAARAARVDPVRTLGSDG